MKQKELEIKLSKLHNFENPKVQLEQYQTPPRLVAMIAWRAFQLGDIENKSVADFCCGTGLFAISAALLGGSKVIGIEIDKEALEIAEKNAEISGVDITFLCKDVRETKTKVDTILMNSPFGIQGAHKDQIFLLSALKNSKTCYSIHLYQQKNIEFLTNFIQKHNKEVKEVITAEFEIPRTYSFHKKKHHIIKIAILRSA
ncbi:MAG: methyltransferase [Candidatus Heimdallarchaeota archaeon]|nr:methyltransferase [Candidatus Heimdallarchaeota archaeon]MCK4878247.1 methyltransferase [Candidatus Heimdallarchaeota archaeon]